MKRLIGIIALLVFIVAISGCTSENTSNKTYSANGVTFVYPANATEDNVSTMQSAIGTSANILAVIGDESSFKFAVAKLNSSAGTLTLNEFLTDTNQSIKTNNQTYVRDSKITINGVDGTVIVYKDATYYYQEVYFVKNNTGYYAMLKSTTDNQPLFNQIVNSLQINQ